MTLNELRDEAHATASEKGWHDSDRSPIEEICLMHSELSEAVEELRKGHAPADLYHSDGTYLGSGKPEGVAVELADTIIRILDFCGKYHIDIDRVVRVKMDYNKTRPYRHGGKVA